MIAVRPRLVLWGIGLVLLTLSVFAQVRNHEYINFDDGAYVVENEFVLRGLNPESATWAFSAESTLVTGNWHPITWLSLMLDVEVLGDGSREIHLANLAIHVVNVLLLFGLLIDLTGAPGRSAFVTAVFAVHPLHVESVAWISERKDVLSTAFGLLAIWCYVRQVRTSRRLWNLLSLIAFALSLMAKQMLVTLPFLLLLIDYWPLRRWRRGGEEDPGGDLPDPCTGARPGVLIREKTGYFALTILFSTIAYATQHHGGAVGSIEKYPFVGRCFNAVVSYGLYLRKTVWPADLGVFYPYPQQVQFSAALLSIVTLIIISLTVWRLRAPQPWLITGWLWFLGTLVPVIGIVQIGRQQMADRYMYVPLIGLSIAVAWSLEHAGRRPPWMRSVVRTSAILAVLALSVLAAIQTTYWKDSMSLFEHTLAVAESSLAHTKVGYEHAELGRMTEAQSHFIAALRLDPDYAPAYRSRGNACLAQGLLPEAAIFLERAIELDPSVLEPHYNLGIVHSMQGEFESAIPHFEQALLLEPDVAEVHVNLAIALSMQKRHEAAIDHFEIALKLEPGMTQAHFNLAGALAAIGETSDAISHLQHVLDDHPDNLDVHVRMASLFLDQGDHGAAIRHLEHVLDRDADHEQARELMRRATRPE